MTLVLTACAFFRVLRRPSSRIVPCIMPKELATSCEKYKRFYLNQHSGHKLEWRYDSGQAEITVDFAATCRKALVVSTYQMMVLLVFNSFKRVTYKQMLDVTGIPKSEIANHLLSLCHPKVAVLLKRPNTKKLEDTHQFMINPAYKNALKKVTIPLLRAVDDSESSEEENKCIELQRRHQMDAAIVRIMKTRKTMRHNLLVAEVISQLSARFKPRPNDIKKRVEALIEQVTTHTTQRSRALSFRACCVGWSTSIGAEGGTIGVLLTEPMWCCVLSRSTWREMRTSEERTTTRHKQADGQDKTANGQRTPRRHASETPAPPPRSSLVALYFFFFSFILQHTAPRCLFNHSR